MGRGKSWSRDESVAVTTAWKQVSETAATAREQNSKRFASELYRRFVDLAPTDPSALDGRWCSRSQTAVKTQFDTIGDDALRFNVVLSNVVEQAMGQGIDVNDDRVLRAAIGVHVGACSGVVDFDNIDSVESDWKLFGAWRILRTCPRFAPLNWPGPRASIEPPTPERTIEADNAPEERQTPQIQDEDRPFMPPPTAVANGGGTPMRTLATAAVSAIPLAAPELPPTKKTGTSQHTVKAERNSQWVNSETRPEGLHQTDPRPMKRRRRAETDGDQTTQRTRRHATVDMMTPGWKALELVGEQMGALADALSEYNALSLFSRPEMQGRQERITFFNAMAEKHALKASLDRDKILDQTQRKSSNNNRTASR